VHRPCERRAGSGSEALADEPTARDALMGRADRRELAAIFAGGALGALARTALAETAVAGDWPWATFAANVGGALMLGYFSTRLQERLPLSAYRRPLLGTGLCGALTTFSTMQVELLGMLGADRYGLALGYAGASLAAGLAAAHVATAAVRRVRSLA
jgi:CrcB protein